MTTHTVMGLALLFCAGPLSTARAADLGKPSGPESAAESADEEEEEDDSDSVFLIGMPLGLHVNPMRDDFSDYRAGGDIGLHGVGVVRVGASIAIGTHTSLGFSVPAGLSYEFFPLMVGAGWSFGRTGLLSVTSGLGINGDLPRRVPFGMPLALEVNLGVPLGRRAYLHLWARPSWVAFSDLRSAADNLLPFADELQAGVNVLVAEPDEEQDLFGLQVGAMLWNTMGVPLVGLRLGLGMVDGPSLPR